MSIAGAVRIICAQALLLLGLASPGLAEPTAASTPSEDNEACAWISSRQDFSSPLPRPGWGDLVALSGRPDGSRLWAVGGKGRIVGLTGGRVQEEESGSDVDLYAVWAGSADEAWAVGARGTLLHRQDGVWRLVPSGTGRCLFAVWGRNPRDLWVGGNDGLVLHGDGSAWRRTPTGSQGPITQLID